MQSQRSGLALPGELDPTPLDGAYQSAIISTPMIHTRGPQRSKIVYEITQDYTRITLGLYDRL